MNPGAECRSTYFRIRAPASKVVISGEIRVPKSASNWPKITEMKVISAQKYYEVENSECPIKIRAPGRIRAPHDYE